MRRVLPNNGVVDRLSRFAAPDKRRLALIGDAERGQIARLQASLAQDIANGGERCTPQILGIMLDPPRMRKDLPEFLLRDVQRHRIRTKNDGAG